MGTYGAGLPRIVRTLTGQTAVGSSDFDSVRTRRHSFSSLKASCFINAGVGRKLAPIRLKSCSRRGSPQSTCSNSYFYRLQEFVENGHAFPDHFCLLIRIVHRSSKFANSRTVTLRRHCSGTKCRCGEADRIARTWSAVPTPLTEQVAVFAKGENEMVQRHVRRVGCKIQIKEVGIFLGPQGRGLQLRVEDLGGIRNFRSVIQIKDVGRPQCARLNNPEKAVRRCVMVENSWRFLCRSLFGSERLKARPDLPTT
jgi:hypothetical protein